MKMTQRLPPPLPPGDWWMEETRKAQLELFGVSCLWQLVRESVDMI